MFKKPLLLFLLPVIFFSCKSMDKKSPSGVAGSSDTLNTADTAWWSMPPEVSIDSFPLTEFVPTLENPADPVKNTIYAATLLYAWDTLAKMLPGAVVDDRRYSKDFNLLRRSVSFRDVLRPGEYTVVAGEEQGLIIAEAYFRKVLPFPAEMDEAPAPLVFEGQEVKAFGKYGKREDITTFSELLYYAADDYFLLKLLPEERGHEIWLLKSPNRFTTLGDVVNKAGELKTAGIKEAADQRTAWKYMLNDEDTISIPEVRFNISAFFRNLEGPIVMSTGEEKRFVTAFQRNAFVLNKSGAVAESYAMAAADSSLPAIPDPPRPKRLVFDRPFYIILKRTDNPNPYFVMRVANAELLVHTGRR